MPRKGIAKRAKRISARGEASGKDALKLARKRAGMYKAQGNKPVAKGSGMRKRSVPNRPAAPSLARGSYNLKQHVKKTAKAKKTTQDVAGTMKSVRDNIWAGLGFDPSTVRSRSEDLGGKLRVRRSRSSGGGR